MSDLKEQSGADAMGLEALLAGEILRPAGLSQSL